jgi:hypothetical protein
MIEFTSFPLNLKLWSLAKPSSHEVNFLRGFPSKLSCAGPFLGCVAGRGQTAPDIGAAQPGGDGAAPGLPGQRQVVELGGVLPEVFPPARILRPGRQRQHQPGNQARHPGRHPCSCVRSVLSGHSTY